MHASNNAAPKPDMTLTTLFNEMFSRQEEQLFPSLWLIVSTGIFMFKPVLLRLPTPSVFKRNVPNSGD
jgi:hypothetical protein